MAVTRAGYAKQLLELWKRLQPMQRVTIGAFALLVAAGLGSLIYFMNRVDYEVLYRDLNPEDASAIASKLKDEKRDYRVEGTSILVAAPATEVDKLRLEIAGSGLARSGRVGYEIFDKNQFGMTDFTEQVNLQRALEGELARTISSLSEISQARVHIVFSKDSLFEDKKEEAKASVAVRLKKGVELSKASIAGIKGLVEGAVPGLRAYNVSIVDDQGRLLSSHAGGEGGRGEAESGYREYLEKEMVSKVISILEPVVGQGKVHANASIDLDVNVTEQTEESFTPGQQAVLSHQKTEERVGSSAPEASGVPGTQSNVAPGPAATTQATTTVPERLRQSEATSYEVSKLVRHTVQPKGTIRRVSVAVILDYKPAYAKGPDGKVNTSYQPRSQEDLDAYRELVLAAVGYDKDRGDTVTLENVPFYYENQPEPGSAPVPWYVKWQGLLRIALKYAAFLVLFLLVYLVLYRPMRKRVYQSISGVAAVARQQPSQVAPGTTSPVARVSPVSELPAGETAHESLPAGTDGQAAGLQALDEQIEKEFMKEAQMLDAGIRKYAVLKKKLAERAKREPEMVSQLIRSWMNEKA